MKKSVLTLMLAILLAVSMLLSSCDILAGVCPHTDEDGDFVCDLCGATIDEIEPTCEHKDENDDDLCDLCGKNFKGGEDNSDTTECSHKDEDDDALCDICGEEYSDDDESPEAPLGKSDIRFGFAVNEMHRSIISAAVLIDSDGTVLRVLIDEIDTRLHHPRSKKDMGDDYAMFGPYGSSLAEWYQQIAHLESVIVGKNSEQIAGISTKDADVASGCTIYIDDYLLTVISAITNASESDKILASADELEFTLTLWGMGTESNMTYSSEAVVRLGGNIVFSASYGKPETPSCEHRDADDDGKCDECGEDYTDGEDVVAPHEHSFGEWTKYGEVTTTCDEQQIFRVCSGCKETEWSTAGYENHSLTTNIVAPTCTAQGYTEKVCSVCSFSEKLDYTDIIDHSYTTVTVAPTCEEGGYDDKTCSVCGDNVKDNPTDKLGHDIGAVYVTNETAHWLVCKVCGEKSGEGEHNVGSDGFCTVCDKPLTATEAGMIYTDSASGEYKILWKYSGSAERVIIPSVVGGLPVREINKNAFSSKNITTVVISASVRVISDNAFASCSKLEHVIFEDGVTTIGKRAFYNCTALEYIDFPETLISIGEEAFWNCTALKSITLTDGVEELGSNAFRFCESLASFNPGNAAVDIVGTQVFADCAAALYTVYGEGTYVGNSENPYAVLIAYADLEATSVVIHEDTEIIGGFAFSNSKMTELNLPASVRVIGWYAFYNCDYLTELIIPDTVVAIGDYAFGNCHGLTDTVTIGRGVKRIDPNAFNLCQSLQGVIFADTEGWSAVNVVGSNDMLPEWLSDPATAVNYLRNSYGNYTWYKS